MSKTVTLENWLDCDSFHRALDIFDASIGKNNKSNDVQGRKCVSRYKATNRCSRSGSKFAMSTSLAIPGCRSN